MSYKIVPVILAGGKGSRLWPISRKSFPKQFLNLFNEEYTLLQETYKRIENIGDLTNPLIICNEEHRFIVGHQMKAINIRPLSILLEPEGRNTTPAITIAALKALEIYKDTIFEPILLILSSDHQIDNVIKFHTAIQKGLEVAKRDNLVIFGIRPESPSTDYGYIKAQCELSYEDVNESKVDHFIEKPNKKTAKLLLKDKKYSWNSGMFIFKASSILNEIKKFAPDTLRNCERSLSKSINDLDFLRIEKKSFINCANLPIDITVFEKTKKAFVIPLSCGWNDIGSWDSLWKMSKKNLEGNFINGKALAKDTKDSLIISEDKLVVSIGLENVVIVETRDAVLVSKKNCLDSLKEVVSSLNKKGFDEAQNHKKVYRPWGSFLSLEAGDSWQIKKIDVNPGASLSLQKHLHRSEHWVVVCGTAKIEIGNIEKRIGTNESAYIPLGVKHRLSNPTDLPLVLIEIQSGSYLGEDDIERFEDLYQR